MELSTSPQPDTRADTPDFESSSKDGDTTQPEQDNVAIPRQTLYQLAIAVTFFIFGFAAALLLTQLNEDRNQAVYQSALNEAVSRVLAALPAESGAAAAAPAQPEAPDPNRRYEISPDDDPYHGAEDAPIVIVEFSDFRCPYCGRFAEQTLPPLLEQYGDQVRFVYRDFPILGDMSFQAALASECADDQEAFWPYHDLLFANQQNISPDTLLVYAEQLELDTEAFQTCLDEQTHAGEITADFTAARQAGASGTPAFFINGRFVSGAQPLQVYTSIIDEELAALEDAAG